MGALVTHLLNRAADRRRESLRFINQYLLDPAFRTILANNVQTIRTWKAGDRSVLQHFVLRPTWAPSEAPFEKSPDAPF